MTEQVTPTEEPNPFPSPPVPAPDTTPPEVTEDQSDVNFVDHPDEDPENELADDAEVDALVEGVSTDAPVQAAEEDV